MRRIQILALVTLAFTLSLPLVGWWLLAGDEEAKAGAASQVEKAPADLPKPNLEAPPHQDIEVKSMRDPIRALDPDAMSTGKPAYESIELPDGSYEIWIDGQLRGIVGAGSGQTIRREDSGRYSDLSYNPELRRIGFRIGSDGQPKRLGGDGEIPATWEDLRRAQGFGR